jgi:hypothetical protein
MKSPTTRRQIPAVSGAGAPGAGRRWTRFVVGLLGILLFAFVAIPALQRLGPVREVREAIQNRGIDASALFYTESEVFSEAETSIRDALRYPAQPAASPLRR